ncbi:MAG: 4-vinyl reductase [Deltaproteobacteria bacterium]|nr:4-vinyl reductase [Deltaproteobacteria bacterium]MBW1872303.1 4-vinyl reductase [Deltaproteobacteria bacterium]
MARVKGTFFIALKSFIRARYGNQGWKRLIESLPEKDRVQVEMSVSMGWFDLDLIVQALHVLVEVLGGRDKQLAYEFGRFDAEQDLTKIQRLFLRMANPAYVIEKAGQYWSRFCDFGEWQIERQGKNQASASLVKCSIADELYCLELSGYLNRLFEMVGAKNLQVEHTQCRARGDDKCSWVGKWD